MESQHDNRNEMSRWTLQEECWIVLAYQFPKEGMSIDGVCFQEGGLGLMKAVKAYRKSASRSHEFVCTWSFSDGECKGAVRSFKSVLLRENWALTSNWSKVKKEELWVTYDLDQLLHQWEDHWDGFTPRGFDRTQESQPTCPTSWQHLSPLELQSSKGAESCEKTLQDTPCAPATCGIWAHESHLFGPTVLVSGGVFFYFLILWWIGFWTSHTSKSSKPPMEVGRS